MQPFESVEISSLPVIDYCELRREPNRLQGKVVKIRAQVYMNLHGFYFYDEACSDKTNRELLDDQVTSISLYEPTREQLWPKLIEPWAAKYYPRPSLDITAVGRLRLSYPTGGTDTMSDRTSFHFELFDVTYAL